MSELLFVKMRMYAVKGSAPFTEAEEYMLWTLDNLMDKLDQLIVSAKRQSVKID